MISRVNLIPKTPLSESIKGLIPVVFIILILLFALFFSIRIYLLESHLRVIQAEVEKNESLDSQRGEIAALVASLESGTAFRKDQLRIKTERVAKLSKIVGEKREFTRPLLLIADVLPATIRCTTIEFSGKTGTLVGTALDYNDLIMLVKNLQDDPIFNNVLLVVTDRDNTKKLEKIQFSIDLTLG